MEPIHRLDIIEGMKSPKYAQSFSSIFCFLATKMEQAVRTRGESQITRLMPTLQPGSLDEVGSAIDNTPAIF